MNKLVINPPPSDRKCERCKKHIDELTPFGGPGDPLVGDFTGIKLVKNFRPMVSRKHLKYNIDDYMENGQFNENKFLETYSTKDLEDLWFEEQLASIIEASWECRDCFLEDD